MTTLHWMLLGWLMTLFAILVGVVAFELWQVLMAVMVVYVMIGGH